MDAAGLGSGPKWLGSRGHAIVNLCAPPPARTEEAAGRLLGELGGEVCELEGIKAVRMGETIKAFTRASEEEKNAQEDRLSSGRRRAGGGAVGRDWSQRAGERRF